MLRGTTGSKRISTIKNKQHSLSEVLLNKQLIISLRTVVHDGLRCFATVRDFILSVRSALQTAHDDIVLLVVQKKKALRKECLV